MTAPWTQLPEAAALLASCAANPPALYRNADRAWHYDADDSRIRRLNDIADTFFAEVIMPLHAEMCAGTPNAMKRDAILALYPTVDAAIEAARHAATVTLARVA